MSTKELMFLYCGAGEDSWGSLGQQGDKTIHPKGDQPSIFIGRTDTEAEAPIIGSPDVKSQLTGKASDASKNWGQEEKGMTEDEIVGWYYQLNGHEFEQTLGDAEGQQSLVCCSPWVGLGCSPKSRTWQRLIDKTDKVDSFGLFTDGSCIHSFPAWDLLLLGSNAQTPLKTEIGAHAPTGTKKTGSVSFRISANAWNVSKSPMFTPHAHNSNLALNVVTLSANFNIV